MGSSTWSDIVKNVADLGRNDDIRSLLDPESDENIDNYDYKTYDWKNPPSKNGWTKVIPERNERGRREYPKSGKKKSLYAELFRKDNKEVFILNTDEYAAVCEYWYVVYSDDKSAVEMFLKDFGIKTDIEDMDSVCQTL